MSQFKLNQLEGKKEFDHRLIQLNFKNLLRPLQQVEPFYFVLAADSQFGLMEKYMMQLPEPKWDEEIKLSETFIDSIHRLRPKPKFLVVCGDFIHEMPSTIDRDAQVIDFKRIFSKLDSDIPLVCVCGNHDVGDIPTLAAIDEYKREFGEDYFYFVVNNVLFIVINSQLYENRDYVKEYAAKQDEWLEMILDKCKHFKHSIVFEHIPWFINKNSVNVNLKLKWLRKFERAGIEKIFSGHYHKNARRRFGVMELIVTSAIGGQFGKDKSGARLVKVTENSIEHQYYATEDMPTRIELEIEA